MPAFPAFITLGAATDLDITSVTINGTYGPDNNGFDIQSPITLYYGTVTSPTPNVSVPISSSPFTYSLTGLQPGTKYYAYARGYNGLVFVSSPEITFTTAGAPFVDGYDVSNSNANFTLVGTGGFNQVGQTFMGNGSRINTAYFWVTKIGAPTGPIYARLYNVTGTYGSTALPTGSAIASSTSIDASTISTTSTLYAFPFTTPYLLANGTPYAVTLDVTGDSFGGSDRLSLRNTLSSGTHAGNRATYDNLISFAWTTSASQDICFMVTGNPPFTGSGAMLLFM